MTEPYISIPSNTRPSFPLSSPRTREGTSQNHDFTIGLNTKIGTSVEIGKGVSIGGHCKVSSHTSICENTVIEDHVFIGHNVRFLQHPMYEESSGSSFVPFSTIRIQKTTHIQRGVSIGSCAIISPGVTIGENSIIGAGSVVNEDVPANTIVVGNPGRVVRNLATP